MPSRTEQELRGRVATLEERIEVLCKENAEQRDAMRRFEERLAQCESFRQVQGGDRQLASSPRKSRLLGGIRKSQTKSAIDGNDKGIEWKSNPLDERTNNKYPNK